LPVHCWSGAQLLFFCRDWQDDRRDPAVLQPALDRKCGLIVKDFLERVFMAEHDLPGEEGGVREFLCDILAERDARSTTSVPMSMR